MPSGLSRPSPGAGQWPGRVAGWRELRVVGRTGSTNSDLVAAAAAGEPAGLALVAEEQTAGRGRLGRTWVSTPGTGLTFSVLVRPQRPASAHAWVPLLTGVAVVQALTELTGAEVAGRLRLKWPNDVQVADSKVAGVLVQWAAGAVVIGVGINVATPRTDLPVPNATSLLVAGSDTTDRAEVLTRVLTRLAWWLDRWDDQQPSGRRQADDDLRADYRALCGTLGQRVRVQLPGDRTVEGTARDIDAEGRLELTDAAGGVVTVGAGDVLHLR